MAQQALAAHGVAMSFGVVPVLRDIEFELWPGRLAVITGANGSGKSTLIKIFAGLLRPSRGVVRLFDRSDGRCKIGLVSHQSFLYPRLTAAENLEFYAGLYGLSDARERAARWLARTGLEGLAGYRVRAISRGNEQRLAIARALIADPDLLMMDEPFNALDSDGVALVKELIDERLTRGAAVLITVHGPDALAGLHYDAYSLRRGRLEPSGAEGIAG